MNTPANRLLVERVLHSVEPGSTAAALDLYAGAGNFSLALARRVRKVVAVESDRDAVEAGRRSCEYHGLRNVTFLRRRVEQFLAAPALVETPGIIVLNPPRCGSGEAATPIARLGARRIVYVSCDPTTLARDLRTFIAAGYRLAQVTPIDLFPHTFHVETVCDLELT